MPYVPKSKLRFSETGFSLADTEYKHTVRIRERYANLLDPKDIYEKLSEAKEWREAGCKNKNRRKQSVHRHTKSGTEWK